MSSCFKTGPRTKVKAPFYKIYDGGWDIFRQLAGEYGRRNSQACYFAKEGLDHLKDMGTFVVESQVTRATKPKF